MEVNVDIKCVCLALLLMVFPVGGQQWEHEERPGRGRSGLILIGGFCGALTEGKLENTDPKYANVFREMTSSCRELLGFWQGMQQAKARQDYEYEHDADQGKHNVERRSPDNVNADADGPARRVPHERMTAPGHLRWRNVARRPAGLPMARSAVDKLSFMCDHVSDANPQAEEVVAILEGMDKVCDELADLMSGDNDVNDEI